MSRFTEVLLVSPMIDGKTWIIQRDFGYDVGEEGSEEVINVPVGFATDFASVPRLFWVFIPRWGRYGNAAVIHDYCYWDQRYDRKRSDEIFLEGMTVLNVKGWQETVIYYAVRYFGWLAWRKNQRRKAKNPKAKFQDIEKINKISIPKL